MSTNIDKHIFHQALASCSAHHLSQTPAELKLSIDSRTTKSGDTFLALRGEFADGHDFIADAINRGAALIVAERAFAHETVPVIVVQSTQEFLFALAKFHLQQFAIPKIAITGSNGKTTTKEMIAAALSELFGDEHVFRNAGNKNNHFGLPLSALLVSKNHQVAIFEMGMNHEGEIAALARIVEPDVGVITNIGCAHVGNFVDGIEGISRAKGELFASIAHTLGHAVINVDDDLVMNEAKKYSFAATTTFGTKNGATVQLGGMELFSPHTGKQKLEILVDKTCISFDIPLAGEHNARNANCALAVVKSLNLDVEKASHGLMRMEKTNGRMSISAVRNITIINDGYNANPVSMDAGIKASRDFSSRRRIAAIGYMAELGAQSDELHFELGKLLGVNFDYIFLCMTDDNCERGALAAGLSHERIISRRTADELIEPLKNFLRPGDLLFVKGSNSANMAVIISALE